jgi:hypothetical protein
MANKEQGLKRLACDVFGHTWKVQKSMGPPRLVCSTCGVRDDEG